MNHKSLGNGFIWHKIKSPLRSHLRTSGDKHKIENKINRLLKNSPVVQMEQTQKHGQQYNSSDEFVFVSLIERENTKMAKKNNANNTNTLPEQEFNFIVSDVRIPRMVPLQTLADESGISYKALWQMCKQNKIVHIKSGNKFLVNVDKFIEFLNTGETEVEDDDKSKQREQRHSIKAILLLNGSKQRDFQSILFLLTDRFTVLRVTDS